jgi:hypothetical protein
VPIIPVSLITLAGKRRRRSLLACVFLRSGFGGTPMTVMTDRPAGIPPVRVELVPSYFATDQVVTLPDNPPPIPAVVANLVASMREHKQLLPGWVCPAPHLSDSTRACIEGHHRLAACRVLNLPFWAFDLGRWVEEEERIRLHFQHNASRRVMSRQETAEKAARFLELTGATAAEAAKHLNVSAPTLSRVLGEKRILPELRERAELLGWTVRSVVAAAPPAVMKQAIDFALTEGADGRNPTRDQVVHFIRQKKQPDTAKRRPAQPLTLRVGGRIVTLTVGDKDTAFTVAEDLKTIAAKLGKHGDVPPEGWPFLFV